MREHRDAILYALWRAAWTTGQGAPQTCGLEALERRELLANDLVISEFMASNGHTLADQFGNYPDWLEIYNQGTAAVNLSGWYLTDTATKLNEWQFPATTLAAGGYLVVFASGKDLRDPTKPLHTNFKLDAQGEYLALVQPDGATIAYQYAPTFPPQQDDVSYGIYEQTAISTLVPLGASAKTLVPTSGALGATWTIPSFSDVLWVSKTTGIGYDTSTYTTPPAPTFAVTEVKSSTAVNTLADAVNALATAPAAYTATTINYYDPQSGGSSYFSPQVPFNTNTSGDDNDVALRATGTLHITTAGTYTFAVRSDDGCRLKITGATFTRATNVTSFSGDTMEYANQRGPADSLGVTTLAVGDYPIELTYYERAGGSMLAFFAASGAKTAYDTTFRLVGDGANGGLKLKDVGDLVSTTGVGGNVQTSMKGINASIYVRLPFTIVDPTKFAHLTLRLNYDAGFAAYLNGTLVASANAPGTLTYTSAATAERTDTQALQTVDFDISAYRNLLVAGANVLALQGLNSAASDADFLLAPQLIGTQVLSTSLNYFPTATPGAANNSGLLGYVADPGFDHDHGFYSLPFDLVLSTDTPASAGATIRYTLDGSTPTQTYGTVYTGPIHLDHTVDVRAYAYANSYGPSRVVTESYLFPTDIMSQSPLGQTPAGWPSGSVNGQALDYGMDPDILNDPRYTSQIRAALTALPTIALTTDLGNLFDPTTGIYVNAGQDGSDWERPVSVELINPDGSAGFQINAGLRIRGGYSRSGGNPKHAFRLFFSSEYDGNLNYALFGSEGADSFNKVDLRTAENYSWSFDGSASNNMIAETFERDLQRDLGDPYTRSRWYNLYLNGQYWGLYETEERPDADFAATYFGGTSNDYDVVKVDTQSGYSIMATDGTLDAWQSLWTAATAGFSTNAAYYKVLGLNPDGTRNPNYPVLVDPRNLIDYMIGIYWSGDLDAPISNFLGNTECNNFFAIYNHDGQSGFKFLRHDAEHTLLDVNTNRLGPFTAGSTFQYFNPQYLHQQLMANAEYRQMFIDRVQQVLLAPGAPMSAAANQARFQARENELATAIIAESARWGDAKSSTPLNKNDQWLPACNNILNNYLPQRNAIFLAQLRAAGWFPAIDAPALSSYGAHFTTTQSVTLSGSGGTIYYTLDGSDPRATGGGIGATALAYTSTLTLSASKQLKARIWTGATWSALSQATFLRDPAPSVRVTEIMYHPATPPLGSAYLADDFEYLELKNTGLTALDLAGMTLSGDVSFTFPSWNLAAGATVLVLANAAAFQSRYGTGRSAQIAGQYTGHLSDGGGHLTLGAPLWGALQDFGFKDGWYDDTDGEGFSLVVRDPAQAASLWNSSDGWRPSTLLNGSPGLDETQAALGVRPDPNPGDIVINELLAHTDVDPPAGLGDWIELYNTTTHSIDLSGWYLSDDAITRLKYRIPDGTTIAAGGYYVMSQRDNFGGLFGFSELGDIACLTSSTAAGVANGYRYDESFGASNREVPFTRYIKSTGAKDFVPESGAGTPGAANAAPLVGPVVISEVMYHPTPGYSSAPLLAAGDSFIELYNLTAAPLPLYDTANPADPWKFTAGIDYSFPKGTDANPAVVPGWGYLLVVPIDPATFRSRYSVPANVPIYGPYSGHLSNNGETIELAKPGDPETDGFVAYYRVDQVTYDDKAPWPTSADGHGASLIRKNLSAYGADVANWQAGSYGGTPGAANRAPDATAPTTPGTPQVTGGSSTRFDLAWTASADAESALAYYKVFRNGLEWAWTTTPSYSDRTVMAGVTYSYEIQAVNRDGLAGSLSAAGNARLVILSSLLTPTQTTLQLAFSDALTSASALDLTHYTLTAPGSQVVPLTAVSLSADSKTVTLTVGTMLSYDTAYQLAFQNLVSPLGYPVATDAGKTFYYAPVGPGTLLREYWLNIGSGTAVTDLTGNAAYPNSPSGSSQITSFECPLNWADSYGTRVRGYLYPPVSGTYVFWIASDDASELWLSTDDTAANKRKIAYVSGWTNSRAWTTEANQSSATAYGTITLQAGKRYYVEALQKEGGGGDNLAVRWQLPDGTIEEPIPASRLAPYTTSPEITVGLGAIWPFATEAGAAAGWFTVTRAGNLALPLTVPFTIGGTATSGSDYQAVGTSVTIPGGMTSATVRIVPLTDQVRESNETVLLTLTSGTGYTLGGTTSGTVNITDDPPPQVTGVAVNGRSDRGPSGLDASDAGLRTIRIDFSKAVTFNPADVTLLPVTFTGGSEAAGPALTPVSITGSGTSSMTITLASGAAAQTWVKVRLSGQGTLQDAAGHQLDGEAKPGGSGRGYLYGSADLPTGNGTAGGDAVFYVGNLCGDLDGDGTVTSADRRTLASHYHAAGAVPSEAPLGDLNEDGVIDIMDLTLLAADLGRALGALPATLPGGSPGPDDPPAAPAPDAAAAPAVVPAPIVAAAAPVVAAATLAAAPPPPPVAAPAPVAAAAAPTPTLWPRAAGATPAPRIIHKPLTGPARTTALVPAPLDLLAAIAPLPAPTAPQDAPAPTPGALPRSNGWTGDQRWYGWPWAAADDPSHPRRPGRRYHP